MYSTCMYCRASLGKNEMIERFPIGRRLAFDADKGRLWVVCAKCARWNLTPVEERWEAIEEAERIYHDTRQRLSSDNIGLARVKEGLELVRIGKPMRPEFAAWRYGGEFLKRRTLYFSNEAAKSLTTMATVGTVTAMTTVAPITMTLLASAVPALIYMAVDRRIHGAPKDIVANVEGADGSKLPIRRRELGGIHVVSEKADRWGLSFISEALDMERVHLVDAAAIRVAGLALAQQNMRGASKAAVQRAVATLEEFREPEQLLRSLPPKASMWEWAIEKRLALEMAAHEESERRALESELRELEAAWKDAEEIAAISDNLLLPASVTEWIRKRRGAGGD